MAGMTSSVTTIELALRQPAPKVAPESAARELSADTVTA